MNKIKRRIKKGISLLLTIVLLVSILQTIIHNMDIVMAANGGTPSVTAYATKDELMNTFKQDGTNTTIGKIIFGKDSSGNPLEWYVLGKDDGVTGDNISIFAASPLDIDKVFNSNPVERNYSYGAGTGYDGVAGTKVVSPNHYGASELRTLLKSLASNTSYFTAAEQGLMQATTVTTKDAKGPGI